MSVGKIGYRQFSSQVEVISDKCREIAKHRSTQKYAESDRVLFSFDEEGVRVYLFNARDQICEVIFIAPMEL